MTNTNEKKYSYQVKHEKYLSEYWSESEVKEALERPSDFGYLGDNDDMFNTWTLGPVIEHRDSGLIDKSNSETLQKLLEDNKEFDDKWELTTCNHWAVGWVYHLSFELLDCQGNVTPIADYIKNILDGLAEDYPVLDDSHYSSLEYTATLDNITSEAFLLGIDKDTRQAASEVYSWLWDNEQDELDNSDDQGAYPSEDSIKRALVALGYDLTE